MYLPVTYYFSLTYSITYPVITNSLTHTYCYLLTHLLTYTLTYSLIHILTYSPIYLLTYRYSTYLLTFVLTAHTWTINLITHKLTRSLIYYCTSGGEQGGEHEAVRESFPRPGRQPQEAAHHHLWPLRYHLGRGMATSSSVRFFCACVNLRRLRITATASPTPPWKRLGSWCKCTCSQASDEFLFWIET